MLKKRKKKRKRLCGQRLGVSTDTGFKKFFIYSRYQSLIRYMTCKYFLPFFGLPFHSVGSVLFLFFRFTLKKIVVNKHMKLTVLTIFKYSSGVLSMFTY